MSGEVRDNKEMSEIPIEAETIEITANPWLQVKIDGREIYVGSVAVEWDGRTGETPRPRVVLGITPKSLKFIKTKQDGSPVAVLKVDNAPAVCVPTPSSGPRNDNYLGYRNEFGIELPDLGLRVKSNPAQFAELVARTQIEHGLAVVIDPAGPGEAFASLVMARLGGRVRKICEEVFVELFNPDHLAEYLAGASARRAYIRDNEGRLHRLGSDSTYIRYQDDEPRFDLVGGFPPIYAKGSRLVIDEEGQMALEYKQPLETRPGHEELSAAPDIPSDLEYDAHNLEPRVAVEGVFVKADEPLTEDLRESIASLGGVYPKPASESQEQIAQLANFIMAEMPGEPSRSESAVECSIRLLKELRDSKTARKDIK